MKRQICILTALIFLLLSSACALSRTVDVQTPRDLATMDGAKEPVSIKAFPGADSTNLEYLPIITPPEVLRVWVYDHVTPMGDMVVGHWVFLKLRDSKWFIEDEKGAGSLSKGDKIATRVPYIMQPLQDKTPDKSE